MVRECLNAIGRHPTIVAVYTVFGLQAFLFQAFIRLHQCQGFASCTGSLAKGLVWCLAWPLYWLGYLFLF
jgi:hypothetical protein